MKPIIKISLITVFIILLTSCSNKEESKSNMNIVFLHHSVGEFIWDGKPPSILKRAIKKISPKLADNLFNRFADLPNYFKVYNQDNSKNFSITEIDFPKLKPYGWNNNPFDYYNIWVVNEGDQQFLTEPTLEILTKDYEVIIFKHCYPINNIKPNLDSANINSWIPTLDNYKLQYNAIRDKLHMFSDKKFILFTGAAQVQSTLNEEEALRSKMFFDWVINNWDISDDNIYLWDLYSLQTEGGLYLKNEYAMSPNDSHPNKGFASKASKLLFNRIIDIIDNNGEKTELTGEYKN
jgi:hypothetical protein